MALFRYLIHLMNNPCNSEVHEKQKWLLACFLARSSPEKRDKVYERLNSQLDTMSLVTTFMAGFSFIIISDSFDFEAEKVPKDVVIGLVGLAFVFSVGTTLIAITVKTHVTEIGSEGLPSFFVKFSWTMSLLAHLIIVSIGCFMSAGVLIVYNRFQLWIGNVMVIVVGIIFGFLAMFNLSLRDRSMYVLGFDFSPCGGYRIPDRMPVLGHNEDIEMAVSPSQAAMIVNSNNDNNINSKGTFDDDMKSNIITVAESRTSKVIDRADFWNYVKQYQV